MGFSLVGGAYRSGVDPSLRKISEGQRLDGCGSTAAATGVILVQPDLFARYADRPLPRYTSYPTAPHFGAGVNVETYREWLGALSAGAPVSLYLHVPFCQSMCWYCGCHATIPAL